MGAWCQGSFVVGSGVQVQASHHWLSVSSITLYVSSITRPQIFSGLVLAGPSLRSRRRVLRPGRKPRPRQRPNGHPRNPMERPKRSTSLRLPQVRENVHNLSTVIIAPKLSTLEPSVCSMHAVRWLFGKKAIKLLLANHAVVGLLAAQKS